MTTIIELGDQDAAFIFRADGSHEVLLPQGEHVTDHAAKAAYLAMVAKDDNLCKAIGASFDTEDRVKA